MEEPALDYSCFQIKQKEKCWEFYGINPNCHPGEDESLAEGTY